nr:PQ-loop repeat-containing protein 3 [Pogona vitticeps]
MEPGGEPSGLALTLANGSTIVACLLLKVPQLAALVGARSARGVSLGSLVLELSGFFICLRYMNYYNYPLPTYIEYPIIIVQDIILLLFVLHYSGKMMHALPYTAIFVAGWYLLSLEKWLLDLSMNLSTVISAASKLAQLQYLWETKDSGQVSATTWSLAIYTCATRIFTTLMTTNDVTVLVRFIVMLILNTWVLATVLHYRKTAKKTD